MKEGNIFINTSLIQKTLEESKKPEPVDKVDTLEEAALIYAGLDPNGSSALGDERIKVATHWLAGAKHSASREPQEESEFMGEYIRWALQNDRPQITLISTMLRFLDHNGIIKLMNVDEIFNAPDAI